MLCDTISVDWLNVNTKCSIGAITKLGFRDGWTNDTSRSCKN